MPQPDSSLQVVIDLERLRWPHSGLGRYSGELGQALLQEGTSHQQARTDSVPALEPILLLPRLRSAQEQFPRQQPRIIAMPWRKGSLGQRLGRALHPLLRRQGLPVWHISHQWSKYRPLNRRVPVVLTIHDLNLLHDPTEPNRPPDWVGRMMGRFQQLVERASVITTISEFAASDIRRHLNLKDKPLQVIPNGLSAMGPAAPSAPTKLPPGAFLLTVGNVLAHKNMHILVPMLEHLPGLNLAIAGPNTTAYGERIRTLVAAHQLQGRVVLLGAVEEATLQWLYRHCSAFLFPSLCEGFGLPVLEAMAHGKPVLTSGLTSLPEVHGPLGFVFPSFEPTAMAASVRQALDCWEQEPWRAEASRTHARSFCWQRAAQAYIRAYRLAQELGAPP